MVSKIYARKDAVKKWKEYYPNARKEDFNIFVTGFNMGFDLMHKKYMKLKMELDECQETSGEGEKDGLNQ